MLGWLAVAALAAALVVLVVALVRRAARAAEDAVVKTVLVGGHGMLGDAGAGETAYRNYQRERESGNAVGSASGAVRPAPAEIVFDLGTVPYADNGHAPGQDVEPLGQDLAVRRVAQEMAQYPHIPVLKVAWVLERRRPDGSSHLSNHLVTYDRKAQLLTYVRSGVDATLTYGDVTADRLGELAGDASWRKVLLHDLAARKGCRFATVRERNGLPAPRMVPPPGATSGGR